MIDVDVIFHGQSSKFLLCLQPFIFLIYPHHILSFPSSLPPHLDVVVEGVVVKVGELHHHWHVGIEVQSTTRLKVLGVPASDQLVLLISAIHIHRHHLN